MSSRDNTHKGSSRSRVRDDSRGASRWDSKRERSRSPHRSTSRNTHEKLVSEKSRSKSPKVTTKHSTSTYEEKRHKEKPNSSSDSDDAVPPPPPRITKVTMGFSKPSSKGPIKMSLGQSAMTAPKPKPTVASVFNDDDDDDEPEEMPAEARMRMRNIGRETPTSAGPNSFGKTKQGFCDSKRVFERNLKQAMDGQSPTTLTPTPKFPQTIYKLQN